METTFQALSDASRIRIVQLLGAGSRSVDELRQELGISQSSTSQHLKTLLGCGLVSYRKHGNFRIYSLESERLQRAMAFFDNLWDHDLDRLRSHLEERNE